MLLSRLVRWLGSCLLFAVTIGCWHKTPTGLSASNAGTGGADAAGIGAREGEGGSSDSTTAKADAQQQDPIDAGDVVRQPPPRPSGCDAPGTLTSHTIFSEGFEGYPVGPFENVAGSPWVRSSMGRDVEISTAAASSGTQSLLIQSFAPKPETEYAPLALDALPPRLSFRFTALLDGFIIYEDFVTVGLAVVRSKYDIAPVLALKMSGHELSLVASEEGGASQVLYTGLDYGDPPRANTVQIDIDLCTWSADVSVGVPTSPLSPRAHVSLTPFAAASAIFVSGGLNQAYIDDVGVDIATP